MSLHPNPSAPGPEGPRRCTPPLCEEDFASSVILRRTAKLVNFVWLLAEVHGRPEARKLLEKLFQALASRFDRRSDPPGA